MSFPTHLTVKDSGDQWLGLVPVHWSRSSLKYLANYQNGFAFKPDDWTDVGRPIIRISQLTGEAEPNRYSGELDDRVSVENGDLLFSWSATLDSFYWDGELAWLNQHIFKVTPTKEATKEFLFYLIKFWAEKLGEFDAHGSTMRHIKKESLGQKTYVPPIAEQRQIAIFLDHETEKIDVLISEQERLVGLLREKREAVVKHAVTKGLDSTAPMKSSGLAWSDETPSHWTVCLLKRAFQSVDYGISEALEVDGAVAILRMGNIQSGKVILEDLKFVDQVDSELLLKKGDLLYNRTNSIDLVGKVGMFNGGEIEGKAVSFASYLVRLRVVTECVPEFFSYLLNTDGILGLVRSSAFVAIGQCNLNPTRYGETEVAVPPKSEQVAIAEYLDRETSSIDKLTEESFKAIALLRERRSALISAAVTGKIDVREMA